MKTILILLQKEIRLFLRDKTAMLLTFLVPFFVIFLVGNIFSGMGDGGGISANIKIAAFNESGSEEGAALIEALEAEGGLDVIRDAEGSEGARVPFTRDSLRQGIVDHHYNFALIIPEDFVKSDAFGLRLEILTNPKDQIEAQIINGLIQKSLFTKMPQLLAGELDTLQEQFLGDEKYAQFLDGMAALISLTYDEVEYEEARKNISLSGLANLMQSGLGGAGDGGDGEDAAFDISGMIEIEEDQVFGAEIENPYLTRMIGGYAIMFLLFATTGSAAALFDERNEGMFLRLLSMPVSRTHILWSKYLFNMLLGIVQTLVLFIGSSLLFDVQVFDNIVNLFIVAVFSASACTAFGMLLASVSKTQQQAQGFGTLLIISMSAMGGAWFPVSWMPVAMQVIAKFTVVYWGVEGFLAALWEKAPLIELLPILGMIALITVILNAVSIWRFKTGDLFR